MSYDKGTASYDKGTVSYNKGTGLRNNMKKYNYMDMFELQMKMKKERVNRTLDFGENDVIKNTGLSQRS